MWLQQQHACDLVFWGPGFTGYHPGPLDEIVEELDCDAVLLPDLHHAIPGLWDELWIGADRCRVPVVMFVSDPGSAVGPRTDAIRMTRPSLLLTLGPVEAYADYDAVRREVGADILQRPLGFDPDLFTEGDGIDTPDRDIDILVAGAADAEAYVIRRRIQIACRDLAPTRRVMDLTHPGYWEISGRSLFNASRVFHPSVITAWLRLLRSGGISIPESFRRFRVHRQKEAQRSRLRESLLPAPTEHGQAAFAGLLRRSKLVVTGTTFGIVAEKYYEAAGCGAIGIGDLPPQPGADEVRPAMLVVGPDDDEDAIREQVEALLDDAERQDTCRQAARRLAASTSHLERARLVVRQLVEKIGYTHREHRPLPFRQIAFEQEYVGAVVQTDAMAPASRTTWQDLRDPTTAGTDLRDVLRASDRGYAAVALSGEAALPPDIHLLVEAAHQSRPALACRPAEPTDRVSGGSGELARYGWCMVVAPRDTLLTFLDDRGTTTALDVATAVLAYADANGVTLLEGPGFDEPGARALRLEATRQVR